MDAELNKQCDTGEVTQCLKEEGNTMHAAEKTSETDHSVLVKSLRANLSDLEVSCALLKPHCDESPSCF